MIITTEEDVVQEERRMLQVTEQYFSFINGLKHSSISPITSGIRDVIKEYYQKMPYNLYLMTDHWKDTKKQCIEAKGNQCLICGCSDNLRIHHSSYQNRGTCYEYVDCFPLCDKCHSNIELAKVRFKNLIESNLFRNEDSDIENLKQKTVQIFYWFKDKNGRCFRSKDTNRILSMIARSFISMLGYNIENYKDILTSIMSLASKKNRNDNKPNEK